MAAAVVCIKGITQSSKPRNPPRRLLWAMFPANGTSRSKHVGFVGHGFASRAPAMSATYAGYIINFYHAKETSRYERASVRRRGSIIGHLWIFHVSQVQRYLPRNCVGTVVWVLICTRFYKGSCNFLYCFLYFLYSVLHDSIQFQCNGNMTNSKCPFACVPFHFHCILIAYITWQRCSSLL